MKPFPLFRIVKNTCKYIMGSIKAEYRKENRVWFSKLAEPVATIGIFQVSFWVPKMERV